MERAFYQVVHPWHWLTYGQNATAVAACVAFVAFIGLIFYTRYTGRMMRVQETTARATITPILVTQGAIEFIPTDIEKVEVAPGIVRARTTTYNLSLRVRNIGEGAALYVGAWCQPVSETFAAGGSMILEKTADSKESTSSTHLLQSEEESITIENVRPDIVNRRRIVVLEAVDVSSLRHQLQIVQTPHGSGRVDTDVAMVHADPLLMPTRKIKDRLAATWRFWKLSAGQRS